MIQYHIEHSLTVVIRHTQNVLYHRSLQVIEHWVKIILVTVLLESYDLNNCNVSVDNPVSTLRLACVVWREHDIYHILQTFPSPETKCSPTTRAARFPTVSPVPCVATQNIKVQLLT